MELGLTLPDSKQFLELSGGCEKTSVHSFGAFVPLVFMSLTEETFISVPSELILFQTQD